MNDAMIMGAGGVPEETAGETSCTRAAAVSAPPSPVDWKRTEFAVVTATFIWFAGSNFITPFLPLYIQQVGHLSTGRTALWTGITLSLTPLVAGAVAPLWGMLADRYGRKLLLQRSLLGFTVCLGLMGVAQSPWQLMAIRVAMGVVGGFSSASMALVTLNGPATHITRSVGRVQAARVLGMTIGPIPGGFLADAYGYRVACFVSVVGGVIAFVVVTVMAKEHVRPTAAKAERAGLRGLSLLFHGMFAGIFVVVFATRLAERSLDPIVPLLVGKLGATSWGIATTTALIISAGLVTSAAASTLTGRFVGFDRGNRRLIWVLILGGVPFALGFLATTWWELLILRSLIGVALGVSITLTFSTIAHVTPVAHRGLTLSTLGAGISFGSAAGYLLAGGLATVSLELVFLAGGTLLVLSALVLVALRGAAGREPVDELPTER